ncbi:MAG: zinc metallopeptidase [Bacteroidia bacterium]|nr:zinc metallopeptidase [Bacteroidia bacterium]
MYGQPIGIYIIAGIFMLVGFLVQARLKSKFKKYSKSAMGNGLSGREIAEKMLRDNNIHDVKVVSVAGMLTDHYNPLKKTVNLSEGVYNQRSTAAAAVAAHECGHAVQHATQYSFLQLRSALVPAVKIGTNLGQWVILAGLVLMQFPQILLIGILLFAATTLFSVITLPVEFDASRRALVWLEASRMTNEREHDEAKDALKWAAMTYVVAALSSIATLAYYILIYTSRR